MGISENQVFQTLRKTWQPVSLSSSLISGRVLGYKLLGEDLVLARFNDELLAAKNLCPHRGARLELGKIERGRLVCPYHGWEFDTRGQCAAIPSLTEPLPVVERTCLQTYQVRERYGIVWVKLDSAEIASIPDVPEFEDRNWTYLVPEPMPFKAGFRREIENYLDMSHFAFAHKTTLGVAAAAQIPGIKIERFADGLQMHAPFPALSDGYGRASKLQQAHRRLQRVHLPNFTTIRQTFNDGDERVLVHVPSPNTEFECTVFWALAISPDFKGPDPLSQMDFATRVLEEDRQMVENQRPLEVPLDHEPTVAVPADKFANAFKQSFIAFLRKNSSRSEPETRD